MTGSPHSNRIRLGMVGGGQLARMTHQAAIALGQSLRVLAASPDDGAALVVADVQIGAHTDLDALRRFAKGCDVVTFDHEHVPTAHLTALEDVTDVRPGGPALRFAQDKGAMRDHLSALETIKGLPVRCPRYRRAGSLAEIGEFAAAGGGRADALEAKAGG